MLTTKEIILSFLYKTNFSKIYMNFAILEKNERNMVKCKCIKEMIKL